MAAEKIYLCGPIMDEMDGVARTWRNIARDRLSSDFAILDPMRRNFKDREVDSANEIVEFDRCDAVADRLMELAKANHGKLLREE